MKLSRLRMRKSTRSTLSGLAIGAASLFALAYAYAEARDNLLRFFIGSVLALQSGHAGENVGYKQFIGALVGLRMARELGPVMAAVLLAAAVKILEYRQFPPSEEV